MDDGGEVWIPGCQVAELAGFFAAHDRWLFGHACARTRGDRELAADLVQDTFEAAARAWDMLREHASHRQRGWLLSTLAHKDEMAEGGDALTGQARASLQRIAQDGNQAGNRLLEANVWQVVSLAERFTGRGVPFLPSLPGHRRVETDTCKGATMTHPVRLSVGSSPLAHMLLLARAPERVLALRLAMSSAVGPSSVTFRIARAGVTTCARRVPVTSMQPQPVTARNRRRQELVRMTSCWVARVIAT